MWKVKETFGREAILRHGRKSKCNFRCNKVIIVWWEKIGNKEKITKVLWNFSCLCCKEKLFMVVIIISVQVQEFNYWFCCNFYIEGCWDFYGCTLRWVWAEHPQLEQQISPFSCKKNTLCTILQAFWVNFNHIIVEMIARLKIEGKHS